jgi:ABC-type sugar transport system ATPase subunit
MVDEPTRGIDVGAKNDIYDLLLEEKKEGKSILMFSPEIRELLNVCDLIIVVSMGKLVCEIRRGDSRFNEADVMECMHS